MSDVHTIEEVKFPSSLQDLKNELDNFDEDSVERSELSRILRDVDESVDMTFLEQPVIVRLFQGKLHEMNKDYDEVIKPKLERVKEMVLEIQRDFPQLIGVCFYGSLSKGYFLKGISDIDGKIIIYDPDNNEQVKNGIRDRINSILYTEGMFPGEQDVGIHNFAITPSFKTSDTDPLSVLYQGLFIGDKDQLAQLREGIQVMSPSLKRTLIRRGVDFQKYLDRSEIINGKDVNLSEEQYAVLQYLLATRVILFDPKVDII